MKLQLVAALLASLALCACSSTAQRRTISTEAAPPPIGPYSQAVQVGDTLYVSGQIGADAQSGSLVAGGIKAETRQTIKNLSAVLRLADRHSVIEKGRTVWTGTSAELEAAPQVKEAYLHV